MKDDVLIFLRDRLQHFLKLRNEEMKDQQEEDRTAYGRAQYLQGRIESLDEALKAIETDRIEGLHGDSKAVKNASGGA